MHGVPYRSLLALTSTSLFMLLNKGILLLESQNLHWKRKEKKSRYKV